MTTLDEFIEQLNELRSEVGGEIPVMVELSGRERDVLEVPVAGFEFISSSDHRAVLASNQKPFNAIVIK